jgi:hypothetical protein
MCATLIPLEVYAHRCPRVSPQQRITFAGLSTEISSLPDMFGSINENFVTATVEGALVMVGDSIDLDALQSAADESGADILPAEHNVRRVVWAVLKKWWCSFGYDYVLAAIRATHKKVLICM